MDVRYMGVFLSSSRWPLAQVERENPEKLFFFLFFNFSVLDLDC